MTMVILVNIHCVPRWGCDDSQLCLQELDRLAERGMTMLVLVNIHCNDVCMPTDRGVKTPASLAWIGQDCVRWYDHAHGCRTCTGEHPLYAKVRGVKIPAALVIV